jgi:hypothetical protein
MLRITDGIGSTTNAIFARSGVAPSTAVNPASEYEATSKVKAKPGRPAGSI